MGKSRNRRNVETSIGMPSVPVTQDLQIKANPSPVHPKTDNQRKYINFDCITNMVEKSLFGS